MYKHSLWLTAMRGHRSNPQASPHPYLFINKVVIVLQTPDQVKAMAELTCTGPFD